MQGEERPQDKSWEDIKNDVNRVNSDLASAITTSLKARSESPRFLLLSYPYGADIVQKNQFCFPPGVSTPSDFKEKFAPTGVPLAVVLHRAVEIYTTGPGKITHALRVLYPGELFGTFEATDWLFGQDQPSVSEYSIASGLRSIWIVAPLRRLVKAIGLDVGSTAFDIVSRITQACSEIPRWASRIVCLPVSLVRELENYVIRTAWAQSTVHRQQLGFDREIGKLGPPEPEKPRKTDFDWLAYIDVIKHIASIVRGLSPAYRAWDDPKDIGGPFDDAREWIQKKAGELKIKTFPVPYILRPVQLRKSDDFGFFSFSSDVPGLPLRLPLPLSGARQAAEVARALQKTSGQPTAKVEVRELGRAAELTFFCRGRFAKDPLSKDRSGVPIRGAGCLTADQFLGRDRSTGVEGTSIWAQDKFLLACVRIRLI